MLKFGNTLHAQLPVPPRFSDFYKKNPPYRPDLLLFASIKFFRTGKAGAGQPTLTKSPAYERRICFMLARPLKVLIRDKERLAAPVAVCLGWLGRS
jgi:hypothetical protein